MEAIYVYSILGAIIFLLFIVIVLSGKWFFFGLKDFVKRMKYKSHHGYMLLVDKGGNIGIPKIIDLTKDKYSENDGKVKDGRVWPFSTDDVMKGSFMGRPFLIKSFDDAKTSIGLYFQESDKEGNPLYTILADGSRIRKISEIKPSVSLSPGFFMALVGDHALTQALKELLQKNGMLLLVLLGVGIGVIVSGFISYTIYSDSVPKILEAIAASRVVS